jgi:hypothetical protein
MDVFTINHDPVRVTCCQALAHPADFRRLPSKLMPTSKAPQVESKVWMLCFGSPRENQLDDLPPNAKGIPAVLEYHPFQSIDLKEQAYIQKQSVQHTAKRIPTSAAEFFINFAFMCTSMDDYKHPNTSSNCIVTSYDCHFSHLIIIDGASRQVRAFLTKT